MIIRKRKGRFGLIITLLTSALLAVPLAGSASAYVDSGAVYFLPLSVSDSPYYYNAVTISDVWATSYSAYPVGVSMSVGTPGLLGTKGTSVRVVHTTYDKGSTGYDLYVNWYENGSNNGNTYQVIMTWVGSNGSSPPPKIGYMDSQVFYQTMSVTDSPYLYKSKQFEAYPTSTYVVAPVLLGMVLGVPGVDTGTGTLVDEVKYTTSTSGLAWYITPWWYQLGGNNGNNYNLTFFYAAG